MGRWRGSGRRRQGQSGSTRKAAARRRPAPASPTGPWATRAGGAAIIRRRRMLHAGQPRPARCAPLPPAARRDRAPGGRSQAPPGGRARGDDPSTALRWAASRRELGPRGDDAGHGKSRNEAERQTKARGPDPSGRGQADNACRIRLRSLSRRRARRLRRGRRAHEPQPLEQGPQRLAPVYTPTSRHRPPQRGHSNTSRANTRRSSAAHCEALSRGDPNAPADGAARGPAAWALPRRHQGAPE